MNRSSRPRTSSAQVWRVSDHGQTIGSTLMTRAARALELEDTLQQLMTREIKALIHYGVGIGV